MTVCFSISTPAICQQDISKHIIRFQMWILRFILKDNYCFLIRNIKLKETRNGSQILSVCAYRVKSMYAAARTSKYIPAHLKRGTCMTRGKIWCEMKLSEYDLFRENKHTTVAVVVIQ